MFKFLDALTPLQYWLVIAITSIIALAMIVYGLKPRKDWSKERPGLITPEEYRSLEPNLFRRIIEWLRNN